MSSQDLIDSGAELSDSCTSEDSLDTSCTKSYTFEDLALLSVLNKAKFPVLLSYSPFLNKHLAVKIFPFNNNKMNPCFKNELLFTYLTHENVVSTLHYEEDREADFNNGAKRVSYI